MVLEISHVVVYAKTSLLRTEKPVLDEPASGAKNCGASSTKQRPDIARRAEFEAFMAWLSGSAGLNELGVSIATFRRRTSWCWNVAPTVVPTGEIHHQIMLDGTYFNG